MDATALLESPDVRDGVLEVSQGHLEVCCSLQLAPLGSVARRMHSLQLLWPPFGCCRRHCSTSPAATLWRAARWPPFPARRPAAGDVRIPGTLLRIDASGSVELHCSIPLHQTGLEEGQLRLRGGSGALRVVPAPCLPFPVASPHSAAPRTSALCGNR